MTKQDLAAKTDDAFSVNRYASWEAAAGVVLALGPEEAEGILRSKLTRWAADDSRRPYGKATSKDLRSFLQTNPNLVANVLKDVRMAVQGRGRGPRRAPRSGGPGKVRPCGPAL